ncbi:oligosaccharide biosynthesis protein Alg14-like protein [Pilobolus umbonatus]|nr:oligosaccharide biosynthesis protein Alg14-like protein [Pilobolus umbonatus]
MFIIYFLVLLTVIVCIRLCYVSPGINTSTPVSQSRTHCNTCIFLGSGGHTTEMLQLIQSLDPQIYNNRHYILTHTDTLSELKAIDYERTRKTGTYTISKIPRAREVNQPMITVIWTMMISILKSIKILKSINPDLILCNGPGSCLPICILAYIPRLLGIKKIEIIYVESIARVHSLSFTGRLLYRFADRFLVQWPELRHLYPRSEYKGILV